MTRRPRMSVITPVYNGARFIESCIRNVIDQECPDVEHIIVDGGSTDATVGIIRNYAERFAHIRWISEQDKGQSDAMNKGVLMATADIIGVLNVDDYYEAGALTFVLQRLGVLAEPALLVGNCNIWKSDGSLWGVNRPSRLSLTNMLLERYEVAFPNNPSAYFYHKSLHQRIGPYDVDEHYAMDVHFIFKAVQHACVTYVDKTLGNFRFWEGTKTFDDVRNGTNAPRLKSINDYYFNSMPWRSKLYLYPPRALRRFLQQIRTVRQHLAMRIRHGWPE